MYILHPLHNISTLILHHFLHLYGDVLRHQVFIQIHIGNDYFSFLQRLFCPYLLVKIFIRISHPHHDLVLLLPLHLHQHRLHVRVVRKL